MAWPMNLLSSACTDKMEEETSPPKAEVKSRPNSVSLPVQDLLRHFEAPCVAPPPSARVGDPKLKQRESKPFQLWDLWHYGAFAAWKGEHYSSIALEPSRISLQCVPPIPRHPNFHVFGLGRLEANITLCVYSQRAHHRRGVLSTQGATEEVMGDRDDHTDVHYARR